MSEIQTKPQNFLTLRLALGMENGFLIPWNPAQLSRGTRRGPHHRAASWMKQRKVLLCTEPPERTEQRQEAREAPESPGTASSSPMFSLGDGFRWKKDHVYSGTNATQNQTEARPFGCVNNTLQGRPCALAGIFFQLGNFDKFEEFSSIMYISTLFYFIVCLCFCSITWLFNHRTVCFMPV